MVSSEMLYGTAVTDDSGEKLSTSPLLSLMPTRITSESIDFSIPDYPRLATDNKLWYKKRLRQHGNPSMNLRSQTIKIHIQWLHSQARSIVASFHVCDANAIDKNSRINFSVQFYCFQYMLLGILYSDAMSNFDITEWVSTSNDK